MYQAACADTFFLPVAVDYHLLRAGEHGEDELDAVEDRVCLAAELYPELLLRRGRLLLLGAFMS